MFADLMKEVDMFNRESIARIFRWKTKKVNVSDQVGQYSKTGDNSVSIQAAGSIYLDIYDDNGKEKHIEIRLT
jgi:hypothetical protein